MDEKIEGAAFRRCPSPTRRVTRARRGTFVLRDAGELPCEMCGAPWSLTTASASASTAGS